MRGLTRAEQLALVIADAEALRAEVLAAYAEVDRLRAQVAAVEALADEWAAGNRAWRRYAPKDLRAALASDADVQS